MSVNRPIRANRVGENGFFYSRPFPSSKRGAAKRRKDKTPGSVPGAFYYNYAGERTVYLTLIRHTWREVTYFSYVNLSTVWYRGAQSNYTAQFYGGLSGSRYNSHAQNIPVVFTYILDPFPCRLPIPD